MSPKQRADTDVGRYESSSLGRAILQERFGYVADRNGAMRRAYSASGTP